MIGIILFSCITSVVIAAVVLLSLIKDKAGRIISIIMVLLIVVGGLVFVLYKVSGQQDFIKTFDALSSPMSSSQTLNINSNNSLTNTSDANQANGYDETKAVTALNYFLRTWQQQDISELKTLVAAGAGIKLDSELPLNNQPPITGFEIISVDDFDAASGILPIKVKINILDNNSVKEIIFIFNLSNYSGKWYISGGYREDGSANLFNLNDTQIGEVIPANTQAATPVPTVASISDEEAVQQVVNDYLLAFFDEEGDGFDTAFTFLTGRAADWFVPETYLLPEVTSLDWELMSYNVSEIEVAYGLQLVAEVDVRLYSAHNDGAFYISDYVYHLVKTESGWLIEYINDI